MTTPERRILLVCAAQVEYENVLAGLDVPNVPSGRASEDVLGRFDVVVSGVGKVNAAVAFGRCFDPARHEGVVSIGIAGTLDPKVAIGDVVAGSESVYADEGIITPEGFQTCASMGFPLMVAGEGDEVDRWAGDPAWLAGIEPVVDLIAPIATVSTCSGTDASAAAVRARTGAAIEAMEGAAIGHAAQALASGVRFLELRVVSNTTGDRGAQVWDLGRAFARLRELASAL